MLHRHGSVEEFVVGRPHERIVDHRDAHARRVLEKSAVKPDFMGDAINDQRVGDWLTHPRGVQLDVVGGHPRLSFGDRFKKGRRERPFPANQQSDPWFD